MDIINSLIQGTRGTTLILVLVFAATVAAVLVLWVVAIPVVQTRRLLRHELVQQGYGNRRALAAQSEIRKMRARRPVDAYFRATESAAAKAGPLRAQLFRAGFYNENAPLIYNVSRILVVGVAFAGFYFFFSWLAPSILGPGFPNWLVFSVSLALSLGCITIPSIMLDVYANGLTETYRRGFPDFMDMMITCADAGMSLDAAVGRVSEELAGTHRHLGVQLSIVSLQLRAGKPLRDALREFGERTGLDEARSLAVLFRQSEELGTSLVDTLRVYSREMRTQRALRAEEKANELPVKMVIPLGLCVFPVVLMIVMLPVLIRMKGIFF